MELRYLEMSILMILFVLILWVAPIWAAASLGKSRGRLGLGLLLGIVLGWIGVLLIAVLGQTPEAQRAALLKEGFPCPFCQEPVRNGATVCPHCQRDLPPTPPFHA